MPAPQPTRRLGQTAVRKNVAQAVAAIKAVKDAARATSETLASQPPRVTAATLSAPTSGGGANETT